MRRHHAVESKSPIRLNVGRELSQRSLVERDRKVRVSLDPAVSGKVLATGAHARIAQAFNQRTG